MLTVIHKTLRIIHRSLLVARAARTKGCSLLSFAHSILLRFAAQSFNKGNHYEIKEQIEKGVIVYSSTHKERMTTGKQTIDGVECVWFDKENRLHRETINSDKLELVTS